MRAPVEPSTFAGFVRLAGVFYRAIDPQYRAFALDGDRKPGRYSNPSRPILYLSASPEGAEAAMIAHQSIDGPSHELLAFEVHADRIFDLRNHTRCFAAGFDPADAEEPWDEILAAGGTPPSWGVADQLQRLGANGLIVPSRRVPGRWHLVLFGLNKIGSPMVTPRLTD